MQAFFISVSIRIPDDMATLQKNLLAIFQSRPFVLAVNPMTLSVQINFQIMEVSVEAALKVGMDLVRNTGIYILGATSKNM